MIVSALTSEPTPVASQGTGGDRWGRRLATIALLSALGLAQPMFSDLPLALDEHGSYWIIQPEAGASIWERCQRIVATPPL
jgi:hypothetical protein